MRPKVRNCNVFTEQLIIFNEIYLKKYTKGTFYLRHVYRIFNKLVNVVLSYRNNNDDLAESQDINNKLKAESKYIEYKYDYRFIFRVTKRAQADDIEYIGSYADDCERCIYFLEDGDVIMKDDSEIYILKLDKILKFAPYTMWSYDSDKETGGYLKSGKGNFEKSGGKLYCNDILVYDGEFQNGLYDGSGKLYENGSIIYDGEFKAGKRCGKGLELQNSITIYNGTWKNNMRNGHGCSYKVMNGVIVLDYGGYWHMNHTAMRWKEEISIFLIKDLANIVYEYTFKI